MKRLLILISCNSNKSSDSSSGSRCPTTTAASSSLPLAPAAEAAIPIHGNGIATTWNIQLNGTLNTTYNVNVYDVDLFDTSAGTITALQGTGKKVVCYFSAGSSENWRPDFSNFNPEDLGHDYSGWAGERWLDIRSQNVLDIMVARLDLALTKGCDGVDADNMDGFNQNSCFNITANEQLAFNRALANLARQKGLSIGLKNDPAQVASLENYFDFSITEQCYFFNECATYQPFINSGKPVFNIEYAASYHSNPAQTNVCNALNADSIQSIIMALGLDDSYRHSCF